MSESVLKTFAVSELAEVRITAPVRSICPFDLEVDESVLTITFAPLGKAVEIGSLLVYLDGFAGDEISHEELAVTVRGALLGALEPAWLTVEDAFAYHGASLTVRAGDRG